MGRAEIEVRVERPAEPVDESRSGASAAVAAIPSWWDDLLRKGRASSAGCSAGAGLLWRAIAFGCWSMLMNLFRSAGAGAGLLEPRSGVGFGRARLRPGCWSADVALIGRRGEPRDLPAAAFAGGLLGLLTAAFGFAVVQSVEEPWAHGRVRSGAVALFWGPVGALLALASMISHTSPRRTIRRPAP